MAPESRLRVLFVIGSMGGGGAERQVIEILRRLDRSRFEPMLYLTSKQGELLDEVPTDVPIFAYWDGSRESLSGRVLRWMKLTRLLRYLHLARILSEQRIDAIYDRTYLATLDAAGGCWFRPMPRISCCVADPGPELQMHARLPIPISKWLARRAYQSASLVLANSEGLRLRLIEYFHLDPDHVKVQNNLLSVTRVRATGTLEVDAAEPHPPSTDGATSTQPILLNNRGFLVVTAGRLHPEKGHHVLLEAVEELVHKRGRRLSLVIFGQGDFKRELDEYIKTHQLESYVTLAGYVKDPTTWYSKADLFVLPSFFEGMPNALIEAVACGVPALATTCPSGPKEILDHGRCGGLVPPGDSQALASAIEDAMDHPDEWRAKAILAEQRVAQMFDPELGIRRLEELLQQVCH